MKVNKVYCLFEQSGTFKNEFIKLGYNAIDIDIDNQFNETDIQIDLFNEIEKAYNNKKSIFDQIKKEDLIIAFFPCIRFSSNVNINIRCDQTELRHKNELEKIQYAMKIKKEQEYYYNLFCKFYIICKIKEIKCIIENPYSTQHYLIRYFPIKPKLIDYDRRKNGDNFKKPTMYYFINCEPEINIQDYMIIQNEKDIKTINNLPRGIIRSLINIDYADNFIRKHIL